MIIKSKLYRAISEPSCPTEFKVYALERIKTLFGKTCAVFAELAESNFKIIKDVTRLIGACTVLSLREPLRGSSKAISTDILCHNSGVQRDRSWRSLQVLWSLGSLEF